MTHHEDDDDDQIAQVTTGFHETKGDISAAAAIFTGLNSSEEQYSWFMTKFLNCCYFYFIIIMLSG